MLELNDAGQIEAPDSHFTFITAGRASTCGIREDGYVECWGCQNGYTNYGQCEAPDVPFTHISTDEAQTCGATEDGRFDCWGCEVRATGTERGLSSLCLAPEG